MLFNRTFASAAGIAALLAAGAGCADGAETSPAPPSTMTVTESPPRPAPPTAPRPTEPTGPGSEYDVTCTGGPDEGTICTNPNHGAGDDPYGTSTPTTTTPR
ncbi:hypothetical protein [Tsukamurella paurometabola]|uniref:Lipoprotein n=1 Tax=Tsukamurella paurometabola TaxID=2061 RepID=A0A3P8LD14_TSUPA|nr:hypothetical protein [Tsukamurella paurometabola]UEA85058.1 hypothetical protein LK411_09685 [Tsukamurella paurometabola]VDR37662.1 Uncharacterised protein [Tsukamurella paurometabola]